MAMHRMKFSPRRRTSLLAFLIVVISITSSAQLTAVTEQASYLNWFPHAIVSPCQKSGSLLAQVANEKWNDVTRRPMESILPIPPQGCEITPEWRSAGHWSDRTDSLMNIKIENKTRVGGKKTAWSTDQVVLKYKESIREVAAKKHPDIKSEKKLLLDRVVVLNVTEGKVSDVIAKLKDDPDIEYVEPNYVVTASFVPNDPYYRYQWHFSKIQMEKAWDLSTGAGVTVAILDTGIAYEDYLGFRRASDLAGTTLISGYDFVNNDAHPNDDNGHGTHVCGTVAQTTNNGIGVAGIAFNARIMPVKVLNSTGSGYYSWLIDGIVWAVDHGAYIINMSLGGSEVSSALEDAVNYGYNHGVTLIAAAGNDGAANVDYPARYQRVISVGAIRYDETRVHYSNYGSRLDFVAPGGDVTVDQNGDGYRDGVLQQTFATGDPTSFAYYFWQGTSMAAPHVSGLAALLYSRGYTAPDQIKQRMIDGAKDLGSPGWDTQYGYGLIQAYYSLGVQVTVTSSQTGYGFVKVDGSWITTPRVFAWISGSSHTVDVNGLVSGGTGIQYVWVSWSDGGSASHTIMVTSPTTYTANFKTQYYLTMQANPPGGGTVSPSSGWCDAGSAVSIQGTASTGYSFSSWSGSGTGSYTGSSNPVIITMNGPITETAIFQLVPVSMTVTSNPIGSGFVKVDGTTIVTPQTFSWTPGSSHTIEALSPVSVETGVRYVWVSWSDGGAQSHTITVPSSSTAYTANFKKQHLLTVSANPTGGGIFSVNTGWQDDGTTVSVTATANTGYSFYYWSLDGNNVGSNPSYSVLMNSPHSLIAYFRGTSSLSVGLSSGSVPLGASVTLSGTITPTQPSPGIPAGTTVVLSYSLDGVTWNTFIMTKTGSGGAYSVVWYPPYGKNQIYQIKASWSGDSNYEGSTSSIVSLTVTGDFPRISLLVSGPSSTAAGASVTFDVIVTNPGSAISTTLYFELTGPGVYSYFDTQRITVAAGGRGRFQFVWQVSSTASSGQYEILVGLIPPKPTAIAQTLVTIQGLVHPQIAVTPATVARGQTITVTGSGFTTSSTAQVYLGIGGGQTFVFSVNVGSDGQFSLPILIGSNIPVGQRDIRAQDISGNWSNTVFITVTA